MKEPGEGKLRLSSLAVEDIELGLIRGPLSREENSSHPSKLGDTGYGLKLHDTNNCLAKLRLYTEWKENEGQQASRWLPIAEMFNGT